LGGLSIPAVQARGDSASRAAVVELLATLQQRGVGAGHAVPAAERGGRCPLRLAGVAVGHRGGDAHRRADRVEQLRQALALLVVEPAVADRSAQRTDLAVGCGDAAMI